MEILEVNHAELGGPIARHWGLPSTIALGIQYHHTPTDDHPLVCHVVCVANVLANRKRSPAALPRGSHSLVPKTRRRRTAGKAHLSGRQRPLCQSPRTLRAMIYKRTQRTEEATEAGTSRPSTARGGRTEGGSRADPDQDPTPSSVLSFFLCALSELNLS